ncbi:hypothetical protein STURON_00296 [Spiroplasma turonicum]|uniref:Transmembrane protein n=1 Tax=Spiroplasma turonicum TaxID=216946 RepID=A0A0K1P6P7_9MOLU|nr:hypothetical protein STURON_00296 [Spiroplasma turonicum]ALX70565.1 hypothetical protein STURO_v1c02970 [Spiroplasma turonicum]
MHLSNLAYFSFIPIAICLIIYLVIESLEKVAHRYFVKKYLIYIISILLCTVIVIAIVVTSLYVEI